MSVGPLLKVNHHLISPVLLYLPTQRDVMHTIILRELLRYMLCETKLHHHTIWLMPLQNVETNQWDHNFPQVAIPNSLLRELCTDVLSVRHPIELHAFAKN